MTEDASAGRLYVDVLADAGGFETDLRRKVTTASERVKARIKTEVDQRGLQRELRVQARRMEASARIKARVEIDPSGLRASLQRAINEATRETRAKVKVDIEVDREQLQRDVRAAAASVRADPIKVPVSGDAQPVENAIDKARDRASRKPIDVRVRANTNGLERLGQSLVQLSAVPLITVGIYQLVGAIGNLVGGLTALVAVSSSAVGALAAIPAAGSAAIQFIGVAITGFRGIGDAYKALGEADKASAEGASATAAQREAAAARIKSAQRSLDDARRSASETALRSNESIRTAEMRVADAHRNTLQAQQALNNARRDAAERLRDLRLELSGAALDEEAAELAVARAEKTLKDTRRDSYSSTLDRQEADLALRQAQQRLKEVREGNDDLRKSAEQRQKAGVKGDAEVVDAAQRVADAKRAEGEAERDLTMTIAQAQRDNADAARRVARAQQDYAEALRKSRQETNRSNAAQEKAKDALKNLTPEGRKFVRYLKNDLVPQLSELRKTAQAGLLPGVQAGIERLADKFLPKLDRALDKTSRALGRTAEKGADTLADGPFAAHFDDIVDNNVKVIEIAGDGLFHVANGMASLIDASGPFLKRFVKAFREGAKNFADFMETENQNGGIEGFLDRAYESGSKLWRIIKNVGQAIGAMARAARPAGNTLLDDLVEATEKLRDWTRSPDGQQAMTEFFDKTVEPTRRIGKLLNRLFLLLIQITDATGDGGLDGFFLVLEALADLITAIGNVPGFGKILTGITLLAGAGLALGLVAGAFGKLYRNLRNIARISGLAKLLDKIRGTTVAGGGTGGGTGSGKPGKPGSGGGGRGGTTVVGGAGSGDTSARGQKVYWTESMPVRVTKAPRVAGGRGGGSTVVGGAGGGGDGDRRTGGGRSPGRLGTLLRRVPLLGALLGVGAGVGGRIGGKLPKFLKGGPGALVATLLGSLVGGVITGDSKVGSKRRTIGTGVQGAATGAGVGATVGLLGGPFAPITSPIGAAIGGTIGGIWGLLAGSGKGGKLWKGLKDGASDAFEDMKERWSDRWEVMKRTVSDWKWPSFSGWDIDWSGMGDDIEDAWDDIGKRVKKSWKDNITRPLGDLKDRIKDRWEDIVKDAGEAWDDIKEDTRESWKRNKQRVVDAATTIRDGVKQKWRDLKENTRETWRDIKDRTTRSWRDQWGNIRDVTVRFTDIVRERVKIQLDKISSAFSTTKDTIARKWAELRGALGAPIRFLVNTVYMRGIRPTWNRVARLFDGPELPEANFAYARGGVVPGYAPGKDRVSALLSPGEGVLVPEAVRGIAKTLRTTGSNAVQALNAAYSNRVKAPGRIGTNPKRGGSSVQRFADGGIVDRAGDFVSGAYGAAREGIGNLGGKLKDLFLGGLKAAAKTAFRPVRALINNRLDDNEYERLIAGVARKGITGILGVLGEKDREAVDVGSGQFPNSASRPWPPGILGQVASNTAAAAAALRQAFPGVGIGMLGSRPNISDHPIGKAIDAMVGYPGKEERAKGSQVAKWAMENATNFGLKYLIWYDQITNGSGWRPYTHPNGETTDPTLRHLDHVHMSFLKDGAVVRPRPGGTTVRIGEAGRSEAVVDEGLLNRRMDDLEEIRRLLKDAAMRPNVTVQAPVTNAVPEQASESLPKVLRRALHLAGVTEG